MGFSLKKIGKNLLKTVESNALPAIGATIGSFAGNPALGYQIGNVVNGAVGLGGSSSDALVNETNLNAQKELANYNAQMQMQLNKQTQQYNLDMWNLTNQYNSPSAQMARYEAAGLNKNLIYGQSNTAVSAPNLEAPKFDTGTYNPVDTRIQRAQLALALQEHKQQIQNQAIENDLKRQQLLLSERDADRSDALAQAQISALKANLGLTSENNQFNRSYKAESLAVRKYEADLQEWNARVLDYRSRNKYLSLDKAQQQAGRRPMLMDYL